VYWALSKIAEADGCLVQQRAGPPPTPGSPPATGSHRPSERSVGAAANVQRSRRPCNCIQ
jgi:hypothetical protein